MSEFKYTLSAQELREALDWRGVRRVRPHSFTKKVFHWPYCAHCGLLQMKNPASRKACRAPCVTFD